MYQVPTTRYPPLPPPSPWCMQLSRSLTTLTTSSLKIRIIGTEMLTYKRSLSFGTEWMGVYMIALNLKTMHQCKTCTNEASCKKHIRRGNENFAENSYMPNMYIYVYIYVCMYVCMYVYISMCIYQVYNRCVKRIPHHYLQAYRSACISHVINAHLPPASYAYCTASFCANTA